MVEVGVMPPSSKHEVIYLSESEALSSMNVEDYYDIDRKISKPGFKTRDGLFNWSCSCVSSYVTSPCGYYFRKFLSSMDRFMGIEDPASSSEAKSVFDKCYGELSACMYKYSAYYKPVLEQFDESVSDALKDGRMK